MPVGIEELLHAVQQSIIENVAEPIGAAIAVDVGNGLETEELPDDLDAYLTFTEDRYGGVEAQLPMTAAEVTPEAFKRKLSHACETWTRKGKRGIWLKIPLKCAIHAGSAAENKFDFHHAKPGYVMMTRWLPTQIPNHLPTYSFTQVGVGGVVVNSKGEVLMVQERVSPAPFYQGSWKLPGGLADPSEDFAETAAREVREETGIISSFVGVVSIRHTHKMRFEQGDLYVVVRHRAETEMINIDLHELQAAEWMSLDKIKSLVAAEGQVLNGKVSPNNWKMIDNATSGQLILGTTLVNSRGGRGQLLYTAPPLQMATIAD